MYKDKMLRDLMAFWNEANSLANIHFKWWYLNTNCMHHLTNFCEKKKK